MAGQLGNGALAEGGIGTRDDRFLKGVGQVQRARVAQADTDEGRQVVRREGVLLARRDRPDHGLGERFQRRQHQLAVVLQVAEQLAQVDHCVAIQRGGIELHLADHAGAAFVRATAIVDGGEVIELALDTMGTDRMGHLAGRVLIDFGQIGEHPPEQRHVNGLATVEQGPGLLDHFRRHVRLGFLLALFLASRRGAAQFIPALLDQRGETGNLRFAEKQQVFGLAIVLELEPRGRQRRLDLALGLGGIASGKPLQQQCLELLGAHAAMFGRDQLLLVGSQADRALEALAADASPTVTAKDGILGRSGIVTVEVGRSEVLDQMELDEQIHAGLSILVKGGVGCVGQRRVEIPGPALANGVAARNRQVRVEPMGKVVEQDAIVEGELARRQ